MGCCFLGIKGLRYLLGRILGVLRGRLWYTGVCSLGWCGNCVFETWFGRLSVEVSQFLVGWGDCE